MIRKVFVVYDSKAEAYMNPFYMDAKGQAIRTFEDAVNKGGHPFNQHPEDYTLFYIGEYDESSAQFKNAVTPESLGVGIEFKKVVVASDKFVGGSPHEDEKNAESA